MREERREVGEDARCKVRGGDEDDNKSGGERWWTLKPELAYCQGNYSTLQTKHLQLSWTIFVQ